MRRSVDSAAALRVIPDGSTRNGLKRLHLIEQAWRSDVAERGARHRLHGGNDSAVDRRRGACRSDCIDAADNGGRIEGRAAISIAKEATPEPTLGRLRIVDAELATWRADRRCPHAPASHSTDLLHLRRLHHADADFLRAAAMHQVFLGHTSGLARMVWRPAE
jgi:hypothetical protein